MGGYAQGHVCQENGPGVCLRLLNTKFGHLHALSPQTSKLSGTGPCIFCAFSLFSDGHKLGTIPSGQILHVAGPVPGGFHVIAIQESKESWDRFMSETFVPILGNGISDGFTAPPTALEFEATHVYR